MATSGSQDFSVSRDDMCYLAGLVDGEGCIYADKYALRLQIASKDPFMAPWCYNTFKIGSLKTRKQKNEFIHIWVVSSKNAGKILKELLPFLKVKYEQAYAAIILQNLRNKIKTKNYRYRDIFDVEGQQHLIDTIKHLKKYWKGRKYGYVRQH